MSYTSQSMEKSAAWSEAYHYGRRSLLTLERSQSFAHFVLQERELNRDAPLAVLLCRFVVMITIVLTKGSRQ